MACVNQESVGMEEVEEGQGEGSDSDEEESEDGMQADDVAARGDDEEEEEGWDQGYENGDEPDYHIQDGEDSFTVVNS